MPKQKPKLNPQWIKEALRYFLKFLRTTGFPHPLRDGKRGKTYDYPEWLIMFIAVLSVKAKVRTYMGIHKLALQYWDTLVKEEGSHLKPIAESTLRDRLKKICHSPRKPARFIFQVFPARDLG